MRTITMLILSVLFLSTANAAITYTTPTLSPSLNQYGHALVTDENSNQIPMVAVVLAGANGQSGIASAKLQGIHYSSVTGLPDANLYKASGGKKIPVISLVKMNTSTNQPVPLTLADTAGFTMAGDIAMGTHKITGLGDPSAAQDAATKNYVDKIAAVNCNASSGGAASETLTCTGLVATDTILAVSQSTQGANNTAITGFDTLASNSLKVYWTADPGASAVIKVLVKHL